jgi:adenylate cyclase
MVPLRRFQEKAVGIGSIELLTDRDGILRHLPPPYADFTGGRLAVAAFPFALQCALLEWYRGKPPAPRLEGGTLRLGDHAYPMAAPGWRIPYFGGDGTLERISFSSLLGPAPPPDARGRVVLVGNTQASKHDYFAVPFPAKAARDSALATTETHTMAGVEVQGQALDALLQGISIRSASAAERWALLGILAALGTGMAALPLRPGRSLAFWLLLGAALAAGSVAAIRAGIALPALALTFTWLAYAGASFAYHRYLDFSERRAVERLFSRYVSPNVARQLLERPDLVQLGGRRKVVTILFSDIRGFTTLSEQIPPEQVSDLLNLYFTEMTGILFRFDGTLDKFIGDAILAFFGDPVDQPDHPARALECAVAMQEAAASLRERFRKEGRPELRIGVAVHTGPVVVGNNGSQNNFVYTVIGDAVNLTSRLQGLAQRDDVILTESTAALIPSFGERYRQEKMEPVKVKGKAEPVSIVRVIGRMTEGVAP